MGVENGLYQCAFPSLVEPVLAKVNEATGKQCRRSPVCSPLIFPLRGFLSDYPNPTGVSTVCRLRARSVSTLFPSGTSGPFCRLGKGVSEPRGFCATVRQCILTARWISPNRTILQENPTLSLDCFLSFYQTVGKTAGQRGQMKENNRGRGWDFLAGLSGWG